MKRIFYFTAFCFTFYAISSCTNIEEPESEFSESIVGTWRFRGSSEEAIRNDSTFQSFKKAGIAYFPPYSFTFNEDGTGVLDEQVFSYTKEKNDIFITYKGNTVVYHLSSASSDELKLELSKEGLAGISATNASVFSKISLHAVYKNLKKIQEQNSAVSKVCSVINTNYHTDSDGVTIETDQKTNYEYNDEGFVSSEKFIDNSGTEYQKITHTLIHTEGDGIFRLETKFYLNGWLSHISNDTRLDSHLRLLSTNSGTVGNRFPTWSSFEYTEEGRLHSSKISEYRWYGDYTPYNKYLYEYDTNGNLTKIFLETQTNYTLIPKYLKSTLAYTNHPVKAVTPRMNNRGKTNARPFHVLETRNYNQDGSLASPTLQEKYEYEFDSNGRVTKMTTLDFNSKKLRAVSYFYGCD